MAHVMSQNTGYQWFIMGGSGLIMLNVVQQWLIMSMTKDSQWSITRLVNVNTG